jgi:hypothetical protein
MARRVLVTTRGAGAVRSGAAVPADPAGTRPHTRSTFGPVRIAAPQPPDIRSRVARGPSAAGEEERRSSGASADCSRTTVTARGEPPRCARHAPMNASSGRTRPSTSGAPTVLNSNASGAPGPREADGLPRRLPGPEAAAEPCSPAAPPIRWAPALVIRVPRPACTARRRRRCPGRVAAVRPPSIAPSMTWTPAPVAGSTPPARGPTPRPSADPIRFTGQRMCRSAGRRTAPLVEVIDAVTTPPPPPGRAHTGSRGTRIDHRADGSARRRRSSKAACRRRPARYAWRTSGFSGSG